MTTYELAIDEDGEPFGVPPQVAGWRVRRAADGRGRPVLVHDKGKPLVVRANATHAELAAAAGPGRYRLEAVDEHWHKVDGVPVACTGPLISDGTPDDDNASDEMPSGSPARPISYESVLCHMVTSQTRMMERTLSQFGAVMSGVSQLGAVMSGVAELLNAAHSAGITNRVPPQPLLPAPVPAPVESDEEDEGEDEANEETDAEHKAAPGSALMEMAKLIIKETIDKVVPLIFEKFMSGNGTGMAPGGLPLEAIFDWRKAAPNAAPAPSVPASPTAPSAPVAPAAPSAPAVSSNDGGASATAVPSPPVAVSAVTSRAGAAPGDESPPGAAPAERTTPSAAGSPQSHEEAAALLKGHLVQVWQGLSPSERLRATQLVTALDSEERTAWLTKLVKLSIPDAIALARAFLDAHPLTPATPKLPSATPQGDPS